MALLAYLMQHKGACGPHLIIVPNAVMVNWRAELMRWLPAFRCVYFVGSKVRRTAQPACKRTLNMPFAACTHPFSCLGTAIMQKVSQLCALLHQVLQCSAQAFHGSSHQMHFSSAVMLEMHVASCPRQLHLSQQRSTLCLAALSQRHSCHVACLWPTLSLTVPHVLQDERNKRFTAEVASVQFNVLVTTYEYIMRDRAKLSKVQPPPALLHLFPCVHVHPRTWLADEPVDGSQLAAGPGLSQPGSRVCMLMGMLLLPQLAWLPAT